MKNQTSKHKTHRTDHTTLEEKIQVQSDESTRDNDREGVTTTDTQTEAERVLRQQDRACIGASMDNPKPRATNG